MRHREGKYLAGVWVRVCFKGVKKRRPFHPFLWGIAFTVASTSTAGASGKMMQLHVATKLDQSSNLLCNARLHHWASYWSHNGWGRLFTMIIMSIHWYSLSNLGHAIYFCYWMLNCVFIHPCQHVGGRNSCKQSMLTASLTKIETCGLDMLMRLCLSACHNTAV